jgi:hypothetical protein
VISPLPVALVEGRRRARWYSPGPTDTLGARKAKVLHQVNQVVAQLKIRRHSVDRFYAHHFDLRQGRCAASVARIVADSCACACAASDHAAANPPNRLMNSRLLIRAPRCLIAKVPERLLRIVSLSAILCQRYDGGPTYQQAMTRSRPHPAAGQTLELIDLGGGCGVGPSSHSQCTDAPTVPREVPVRLDRSTVRLLRRRLVDQ